MKPTIEKLDFSTPVQKIQQQLSELTNEQRHLLKRLELLKALKKEKSKEPVFAASHRATVLKPKGIRRRATVVRFKDNPFTKDIQIKTKEKHINIERSTEVEENLMLFDVDTGEMHKTSLISYKAKDSTPFIKSFGIEFHLVNLTTPGIKALSVLYFSMRKQAINNDKVDLGLKTLEEFNKESGTKITVISFQRGLKELVEAFLVARTIKLGVYFINVNVLFNGDRIRHLKNTKIKK